MHLHLWGISRPWQSRTGRQWRKRVIIRAMRLAHAARNVIFIGVKSVFGACLVNSSCHIKYSPEVSRLLYGHLV